jgi:hypothetical protein
MNATKVLSLANKKEKPSAAINNRWLIKNNNSEYEKKNFAMRRPHGYFIIYQRVNALG